MIFRSSGVESASIPSSRMRLWQSSTIEEAEEEEDGDDEEEDLDDDEAPFGPPSLCAAKCISYAANLSCA